MFKRFVGNFALTSRSQKATTKQLTLPKLLSQASGASEFFSNFAGATFNGGLYRVHSLAEIEKWTRQVESFFPAFKGKINCFGYDWLGRQFALYSELTSDGQPLVFTFIPGTGKVLEIPTSFQDFHNFEIVDYPNDALASDFFAEWKNTVDDEIQADQFVGYKIPLFLNGEDDLSNLEISDMDVYFTLCGQLLQQVNKMPPGTKISKVSIS